MGKFDKYSRVRDIENYYNGYKVIWEVVVGSQAYGTNTPESDVDIKGVYVVDQKDFITGNYKQQVELDADTVYYEYTRFLQLLKSANPTVLEMLFTPDFTIIINNSWMKPLHDVRNKFITQKCQHSFGGYGFAQVKKAKGLDKKMNYEKHFTEKKTIIDFCWVMSSANRYAPMPIREYIIKEMTELENFGLVHLDHTRGIYSMYHGENEGYRGIANEFVPVVSSVAKEAHPVALMFWNIDAWQEYKKKHSEYLEWLENRNVARYVDTQKHGQKIDGKNLLHAVRLVNVASDIGHGLGMVVFRPEYKYLISIRKGEVNLQEILDYVTHEIENLGDIFARNKELPYGVKDELIRELTLNVYG